MSDPTSMESDSPIARLARPRGQTPAFLDAAEVKAADRLRIDFTRARMMPRTGQRWDPTPRTGPGNRGAGDLSDTAIDARSRVNAALSATGPELSGLMLDVCCFLKGLEAVEAERGWPVRSAKLVLKLGLDMLVRHYGLTTQGVGREGRIRFWGAPDYKPTVRRTGEGGP